MRKFHNIFILSSKGVLRYGAIASQIFRGQVALEPLNKRYARAQRSQKLTFLFFSAK